MLEDSPVMLISLWSKSVGRLLSAARNSTVQPEGTSMLRSSEPVEDRSRRFDLDRDRAVERQLADGEGNGGLQVRIVGTPDRERGIQMRRR